MQKKIVTRRVNSISFDLKIPSLTTEEYQKISDILSSRGISSEKTWNHDLSCLEPPDSMLGINQAVDLLYYALIKQHRVLIIGDYDTDGATSTALAMRVLKKIGFQHLSYLVPNRFDYGYGLSLKIAQIAIEQKKPQLVITVDNGISSIDGIDLLRKNDISVLITDHHLPGENLPNANAIVNPNQPGCLFNSKSLSGVGVMFYVLIHFRKKLRDERWFQKQNTEEVHLADFLDLVALGTIADMVPLDHNNRILVRHGMRRIQASRCCVGIQVLCEGRQQKMVPHDLGFQVAPKINAAGRLEDITVGIECLLSDDQDTAEKLATKLISINSERKLIEQKMQKEAFEEVIDLEKTDFQRPFGYCLFQNRWHQGVVGLIASRIKEKTERPTIVFAQSGDGQLSGSARSVPGVHIKDVLAKIDSDHPGLIVKFGGHAMAAGATIYQNKFEYFSQVFQRELSSFLHILDTKKIHTDGEILESLYTVKFAQLLSNILPWGQGFLRPCFHGIFNVTNVTLLNGGHIRFQVKIINTNRTIDAIYFRAEDKYDDIKKSSHVRLVFELSVNEFRNMRKLQLITLYLEDIQLDDSKKY